MASQTMSDLHVINRKICVITGSRAEYGLLCGLMQEIDGADDLELQVVVTGMHLSSEFGLTYRDIEKDGFSIDRKVEMLLSSDTSQGIGKSLGVGVMGFAEAFVDKRPDLIVVLGDRFEIFAAVSAALIARLPVAHIHGGEVTEGAIDEAFRHSISKMSHLHFVATEPYRQRVIQLGEQPDRVFNLGALGIDNIKRLNLLDREAFEAAIQFKLGPRNLLVTFHPVTLERDTARQQFLSLLAALDPLDEIKLIFTKANADPGSRVINKMIDDYVKDYPERAVAFTSLGQQRYLSALQYVDGVVGNSSSGLIEVPSFNKGTINIGDRQKGRICADSVINCQPDIHSIEKALQQLYSDEFQQLLPKVVSLYGDGDVAKRMVEIIRATDLINILKKTFYDYPQVDDATV